jgi:alkanesulfonate monooxygenase SsuD/methylene tetrahydromethanopterin reductase-like flavin-dependent oxidoreductase (luciferase family)
MEVGVGRGISPYELGYHKVSFDDSRDIFIDAYKCVLAGLNGGETFSYAGKHYNYSDVPLVLKPQMRSPPERPGNKSDMATLRSPVPKG